MRRMEQEKEAAPEDGGVEGRIGGGDWKGKSPESQEIYVEEACEG